MPGSFPLHKVASGFLSLLQMRTLGQNPDEVSKQLMPVVEMREFMGSNLLLPTSGAPTVGALAALQETLDMTAVVGLKAISARLDIGAAAATNVALSVAIQPQNGSAQQCVVASQFFPSLAAGQQVWVGCVIPNWVLPPATSLIAMASGTAAGADHSLDLIALIENFTAP